jgi:hypothetical protein
LYLSILLSVLINLSLVIFLIFMTIFLYLDSLNSVIQNAVESLALFEEQIGAGLTNSFSKKLKTQGDSPPVLGFF